MLTIFETVCAFVILAACFNRGPLQFSTYCKAGMLIGGLGLLGQAFRNIVFITTGYSFTDADLPVWALKDIGLCVVGVSFWKYTLELKKK